MYVDHASNVKNELVQTYVHATSGGKHPTSTWKYISDKTLEKYKKNYLKVIWPGYLGTGNIHTEIVSFVNIAKRKLDDASRFKVTMQDFTIG